MKHRMRQRGGWRYWDCINDRCGGFVLDLASPLRRRLSSSQAEKILGPCRGSALIVDPQFQRFARALWRRAWEQRQERKER